MERLSATRPSTTEPVVRRMRLSDVTSVVALETASFSTPWSKATFVSLLERPAAELWVLDESGTGVVGYAVVWCILDQGEIANIAVSEAQRGRGFGRRLLEAMLGVARTRGVESMYLEVRISNTPARALYEAVGFEEVGRRSTYYDAPPEDALVLLKRL